MREDDKQQGVSVHAGFPNPAAEKGFAETLDIHRLLVTRPASTFLFRIAGQQWQGIGIFDGDIAVIDRALDPRKSDIVAWWDDATGEHKLSYCRDMPDTAQLFGTVTTTIHQLRQP